MPSAISAANPTVSVSVGWGWIVRRDVLGVGAHLERVDGLGDQLAGVDADDAGAEQPPGAGLEQQLGHARRRGASASARPDAAHGNTAFSYSMPCSAACGLGQAHPGDLGIGVGDRRDRAGVERGAWDPAITSAATLPSWEALWASIGSPTTSPIA